MASAPASTWPGFRSLCSAGPEFPEVCSGDNILLGWWPWWPSWQLLTFLLLCVCVWLHITMNSFRTCTFFYVCHYSFICLPSTNPLPPPPPPPPPAPSNSSWSWTLSCVMSSLNSTNHVTPHVCVLWRRCELGSCWTCTSPSTFKHFSP